MPTLPQRDIYNSLIKPLRNPAALEIAQSTLKRCTTLKHKNVEKLLRLVNHEKHIHHYIPGEGAIYVDVRDLNPDKDRRYIKLDEKRAYRLLEQPNVEHIAQLKPADIELIRATRKLLSKRSSLSLEEFNTELYALSVREGADEAEKHARQLAHFHHIYALLLNKKTGPRLAQFLRDIDLDKARELLDV